MEVPNVNWEDIGGLENVKRELQEVTLIAAWNMSPSFMISFMQLFFNEFFILADCSISSGAS